MAELDGHVVAIAGAAGGLGPVVAKRLADAGATIAATDVSQERLDELGAELGLGEERWDGRAVDLLDPAAAVSWAEALAERFGRIDALLHLVGGWRGGQPLASAPLSDYDWLQGLLVTTLQHASRAFHDHLAAAGRRGRFVLVSSTQAQHPNGTNASYASTKAAAETWTLALADSLAESGATANIVVINAIVTAAMREENPDGDYSTFTSTDEIAGAIAYLLSADAAKMNGARLHLH